MKTIALGSFMAATFAAIASLATPVQAAGDPTAALLQRVANGGEGAVGDRKPATVIVGALPVDWKAPVPKDATVVGSIVRDVSGTTVYLDLPGSAAPAVAALDASLTAAGYAAKQLPGLGGFSTAGFTAPHFYCGHDATITVQAYADEASPETTHVNLSRIRGNAGNLLCGGSENLLAQAGSLFGSAIPSLQGTEGMTIDTSTTGVASGAGAFLGSGPWPSSAWGHITSALPLVAVETAIAAQLTAAGWAPDGAVALTKATGEQRFTTPATDKAPAGNALLLVVAGPSGTYDAFIRAITRRKP